MKRIEVPRFLGRHDQHVFHANATITASIETRFDCEDFPFEQFTAIVVKQNRLVNVQPDSVSGTVLDTRLIGD